MTGTPDPNDMLRMARQGLAMNNAPVLAMAFATLDKHLREGGELPVAWSPGPTTPSPQPSEPEVVHLNETTTVVDKRGRR